MRHDKILLLIATRTIAAVKHDKLLLLGATFKIAQKVSSGAKNRRIHQSCIIHDLRGEHHRSAENDNNPKAVILPMCPLCYNSKINSGTITNTGIGTVTNTNTDTHTNTNTITDTDTIIRESAASAVKLYNIQTSTSTNNDIALHNASVSPRMQEHT